MAASAILRSIPQEASVVSALKTTSARCQIEYERADSTGQWATKEWRKRNISLMWCVRHGPFILKPCELPQLRGKDIGKHAPTAEGYSVDHIQLIINSAEDVSGLEDLRHPGWQGIRSICVHSSSCLTHSAVAKIAENCSNLQSLSVNECSAGIMELIGRFNGLVSLRCVIMDGAVVGTLATALKLLPALQTLVIEKVGTFDIAATDVASLADAIIGRTMLSTLDVHFSLILPNMSPLNRLAALRHLRISGSSGTTISATAVLEAVLHDRSVIESVALCGCDVDGNTLSLAAQRWPWTRFELTPSSMDYDLNGGQIEALCQMKTLWSLSLRSQSLSPDSLSRLSTLPFLRSLELRFNTRCDASVSAALFTAVSRLTALTSLTVENATLSPDPPLALSTIPLQVLNLHEVENLDAAHVAVFSKTLTHLVLHRTKGSNLDAAIPQLSRLRVLSLRFLGDVTNMAVSACTKIHNVTELVIEISKIESDAVVAALPHAHALRRLSLRGISQVGDSFVDTLSKNPPPCLSSLDVCWCALTDKGAAVLSTLPGSYW